MDPIIFFESELLSALNFEHSSNINYGIVHALHQRPLRLGCQKKHHSSDTLFVSCYRVYLFKNT